MILKTDTAQKVAQSLLQIKAIKLNIENPFLWASGWKSPIYCDNRIILSYPALRNYIADSMAEQIKILYPSANLIAGVATGGIGIGILVAQKLNLPFVYVRPEAKKHGRKNQIEGMIELNSKIVVIEDLISTGMSSLKAVDALKDTKAEIMGMISVFSYGFETAKLNFSKAQLKVHCLCNYDTLIHFALEQNYITSKEFQSLLVWREQPDLWNQ